MSEYITSDDSFERKLYGKASGIIVMNWTFDNEDNPESIEKARELLAAIKEKKYGNGQEYKKVQLPDFMGGGYREEKINEK